LDRFGGLCRNHDNPSAFFDFDPSNIKACREYRPRGPRQIGFLEEGRRT
jgi:hypothetical protein